LNHVDATARIAAARLVKDGHPVSCAWPVSEIQRFMKRSADELTDPERDPAKPRWHHTVEWVGFQFHGTTMTHLDSPAHIFWDGHAYNGVPARAVNTEHCPPRVSLEAGIRAARKVARSGRSPSTLTTGTPSAEQSLRYLLAKTTETIWAAASSGQLDL
jgi:hypothetical protein